MDANLKCPMCGGQFNSQQELDEHTKEIHGNQTGEGHEEHSITCSKCEMKANSTQELNEHEQHHSM